MRRNPVTKQVVFIFLLALPASGVHAADPPIPTNLTPPPGAAAAGFNRLVFQEEFNDLRGIDVDDTRKPGFNFYTKLRVGDDQHFIVILGAGQWPIRVDWVRVWAK